MSTTTPLNSGLYRVHRIFFFIFSAIAVMGALLGLMGNDYGPIGFAVLIVMSLGMVHWFAAEGARNGKPYGKILSRILGTLWLFGFPLGTALGVYVWFQTGSKWTATSAATE